MSEQLRVLVAEDNVALREVVRFNLEQAGYAVTTARNGREALELLEENEFEIVITDQQMPEMTGYELCQRMLEDERQAQTPVIMLTAKGFELDLAHLSQELGIRQVMVKPFSPQELIKAVQDCLASDMANS